MTIKTLRPPTTLRGVAKAEFKRVAEELQKQLLPLDLSILTDYAIAEADVRRLEKEVEEEGEIEESRTGGTKLSGKATLLKYRRDELAKYRKDLLLTPYARKVEGPKKEDGKKGVQL